VGLSGLSGLSGLRGVVPTQGGQTIVSSSPTYSLSSSPLSTVQEGNNLTITLTTTNVSNGTNVPYEITGVSSADINGASLTGNFNVTGNSASLVLTITDDASTEGTETLTLTLSNSPSVNIAVSVTDAAASIVGRVSGFQGETEAIWTNGLPDGLELGMNVTGTGIPSPPASVTFIDSAYVRIDQELTQAIEDVIWTFSV
jgi:hypothetical protein